MNKEDIQAMSVDQLHEAWPQILKELRARTLSEGILKEVLERVFASLSRSEEFLPLFQTTVLTEDDINRAVEWWETLKPLEVIAWWSIFLLGHKDPAKQDFITQNIRATHRLFAPFILEATRPQ